MNFQQNAGKPFHLFEYEGLCFAYHYALGTCVRLSNEAYKCLVNFQKKGTIESGTNALFQEIDKLKALGFFSPYQFPIPNEEKFEDLLFRRYATPWTKLELALSEKCNLACRYCYCGTCRDEVPNFGIMSESIARQAINGLFAVSGRAKDLHITLFGGEPLMNKPVLKFVVSYSQHLAVLHGKKVTYSMTTNGTLLDDEIISIIKKYNFGLMVSLDGPKELHDTQCPTRGGGGSYDLATSGIRKLMMRRRLVTVRCTMAHPAPNMMSLVRFFEDFGFSRIVLGRVYNPVYPSNCDLNKKDFTDLEHQMNTEVVPWLLEELKAGRKPKYFPFSCVVERKSNDHLEPISPFKCGACRGTTTVGADGTFYPCHRFVGMKEWIVGSVEDGPDIEKCKAFWRKYHELININCFGCWAYPLCHGPCPWEVAMADGTFRINRQHCDEIIVWIKQGFWFEFLYNEMRKM